ncbi:MAG: hypothetical protein K1060chlam2_00608 [Chlamydiae bacterium]|nr:hypothetical protein [Chlamydiota bacterium]
MSSLNVTDVTKVDQVPPVVNRGAKPKKEDKFSNETIPLVAASIKMATNNTLGRKQGGLRNLGGINALILDPKKGLNSKKHIVQLGAEGGPTEGAPLVAEGESLETKNEKKLDKIQEEQVKQDDEKLRKLNKELLEGINQLEGGDDSSFVDISESSDSETDLSATQGEIDDRGPKEKIVEGKSKLQTEAPQKKKRMRILTGFLKRKQNPKKTQVKELKSRVKVLTNEARTFGEKLSQQEEGHKTEVRDLLSSHKEKIAQLNAELGKFPITIEKLKAAHKVAIEGLEEKLETSSTSYEEIKAQLEKLPAEGSVNQSGSAELALQLTSLRKEKHAIESSKGEEIAALKQTIEEIKGKKIKLEKQKRALKNEHKEALAALRKTYEKKIKKNHNKLGTIRNIPKIRAMEQDSVVKKVEAFVQKMSQSPEQQESAKVQQLKAEVETATSEIASLTERLEATNKELLEGNDKVALDGRLQNLTDLVESFRHDGLGPMVGIQRLGHSATFLEEIRKIYDVEEDKLVALVNSDRIGMLIVCKLLFQGVKPEEEEITQRIEGVAVRIESLNAIGERLRGTAGNDPLAQVETLLGNFETIQDQNNILQTYNRELHTQIDAFVEENRNLEDANRDLTARLTPAGGFFNSLWNVCTGIISGLFSPVRLVWRGIIGIAEEY